MLVNVNSTGTKSLNDKVGFTRQCSRQSSCSTR